MNESSVPGMGSSRPMTRLYCWNHALRLGKQYGPAFHAKEFGNK